MGKDLTEAKEIRSGGKNTQKNVQKGQDNLDSVVTTLELPWNVKPRGLRDYHKQASGR